MKRSIGILLILTVVLLTPLAVQSQDPPPTAQPQATAKPVVSPTAEPTPTPTPTPTPEPDSCPDIVLLALRTTEESCDSLGRNQACYGHVFVEALPQPFADVFDFTQAGDMVDLFSVQSLRLSSMDLETSMWGVALMNLLSFSTYASPRDVTLLMFGDVEIESNVGPVVEMEATTISASWGNVRLAPSVQAGVLGTLPPNSTVVANGRLEDSSWIRVILPESERAGWVSEIVLRDVDALADLTVVEPFAPYYGPMQAFYFQSGLEDAVCDQAPDSGLVIQTPEGVAEVSLLVNEVNIQLSSTAYLQAQPGDKMTVNVLDGWARLKTADGEQTVYAGSKISVPLGTDYTPTGKPGLPEPYSLDSMVGLPMSLLDRVVRIADPLTQDQIVAIIDAISNGGSYDPETGIISDGSGTSGDNGDGGPATSPPGLDGVLPPGQGGTPPGQGGTPPGQQK